MYLRLESCLVGNDECSPVSDEGAAVVAAVAAVAGQVAAAAAGALANI